jgi:tetratricopeptide (TPR) repeat protein
MFFGAWGGQRGGAGRLRPRGLGWLVAVTAILVIIAAVAGEPWWPIVVTAVGAVAASIVFTAVRRWRAKAAYQRAIDSGHADAAAWAAADLGVLLAEQGDVAGAKAAYQQAIDSGHADAAPRAAHLLSELS